MHGVWHLQETLLYLLKSLSSQVTKSNSEKNKLWTQGSEWDLRNNRRHWNRFIIYRELRMRAAFKYWGKSDYKFN